MGKLVDRLRDASRSGAYRVTRTDEIVAAAGEAQFLLTRVRYAEKSALMKNLAAALQFPEWFGANWDALEDCLADLSWRPASGYVLLIEQARPGDDYGVLVDVLRSSAESWAARGKPFFAVFADPARALALPELFRQA